MMCIDIQNRFIETPPALGLYANSKGENDGLERVFSYRK